MGGNRPADSSTGPESGEKDATKLNTLQVVAATGASTTAAVVANLLGVYGTVIGVAVISVVSSVATVLYLRSINGTRERLRKVRRGTVLAEDATATDSNVTTATVPIRPGAPAEPDPVATATLPAAAPPASVTTPVTVPAPTEHNRTERLRAWWRRNGRVMTVSSIIVFVCSIAVLTGIALLSGQAPGTFYQQSGGSEQEQQQPAEQDDPGWQLDPSDASPTPSGETPSTSDSPSPDTTPSDPQPTPGSPTPSTDPGDDDGEDPENPPSDEISDPAQ